jgi:hypothetical protein
MANNNELIFNNKGTTGKPMDFSYGNQLYSTKFVLFNGQQKFTIPPNLITRLQIDESLSDWVTKGTMTLIYDFGSAEDEKLNPSNNYIFRNDGLDILEIDIRPKDPTGSKSSLDFNANPEWRMHYYFSIYEIEDLPAPNNADGAAISKRKMKRFYFWDIRYHELLSKNIQYSTAKSKYLTTPLTTDSKFGPTDEQRSIKTGQAIREILEKNITLIPDLNKVATSEDEWDDGVSNIFFTAPADNNGYECVDYLLKRHSSKIGINGAQDFCILTMEHTNDSSGLGYFALKPISKYFEKAGRSEPGEYQIEHFFVTDDTKQTNGISEASKTYKAPYNRSNSTNKDSRYHNYSTITAFEYVDISPLTNINNFRTFPVHSIDFKNRQLNIEYSKSNIDAATNFIAQKYISGVKSQGGPEAFLINTNELKQKYSFTPTYSLYGSDPILRNPEGIHNLLKTGLFQNSCIVFTVPGVTTRKSGRFIGIDLKGGSPSSVYADKFFGQWFVISVNHVFLKGQYYNVITAVKIHRNQSITSYNINSGYKGDVVNSSINGVTV